MRTQIRRAVKLLLKGLPTTADNVEVGRTRPMPAQHPPTLLIYTPEEIGGDPLDGNPASTGRACQLFIDGRVVTALPPDDDLDAIALEVERAMRRDRTLSGLVFQIDYRGTKMDAKADGESHIGAVRLEYSVRYWDPDDAED